MNDPIYNALKEQYKHAKKIVKDRGRRLANAGLGEKPIFPRANEFKNVAELQEALGKIEAWINTPTSRVSEARRVARQELDKTDKKAKTPKANLAPAQDVSIEEQRRQRKNERNRQYRQRLKALSKEEKSAKYLAKHFGLDIKGPKELKAFYQYMEKRKSFQADKARYAPDKYIEDWKQLRAAKIKPEQIVKDLDLYERQLGELAERSEKMTASFTEEAVQAFIDSKKGSAEFLDEWDEDY